jgi:hypothetical protein
MHFSRSPEEIELAGEELSGLGDFLKQIGKKSLQATEIITSIPGGKALMAMMPFGTPMLAASEGAKAIKNVKGASGISPPKSAPQISMSSSAPKSQAPKMSGMGAEMPFNDDDIRRLINQETNPAKRRRMILNFERARAERSTR